MTAFLWPLCLVTATGLIVAIVRAYRRNARHVKARRWILAAIPWGRSSRLRRQRQGWPPAEAARLDRDEAHAWKELTVQHGSKRGAREAKQAEAAARRKREKGAKR